MCYDWRRAYTDDRVLLCSLISIISARGTHYVFDLRTGCREVFQASPAPVAPFGCPVFSTLKKMATTDPAPTAVVDSLPSYSRRDPETLSIRSSAPSYVSEVDLPFLLHAQTRPHHHRHQPTNRPANLSFNQLHHQQHSRPLVQYHNDLRSPHDEVAFRPRPTRQASTAFRFPAVSTITTWPPGPPPTQARAPSTTTTSPHAAPRKLSRATTTS